jgi:hypothetical protein
MKARPHTRCATALLSAAVAVALLVPASALATTRHEPRGSGVRCRIRATKQSGGITVTFWLNTSIPHRGWRVRIWDDDTLIFSKDRTTNAAGNIRVEKATPDQPGLDGFVAKARDVNSGALCTVAVDV